MQLTFELELNNDDELIHSILTTVQENWVNKFFFIISYFFKISLSCFDDKRYIHENGLTSYAYGHANGEILWIILAED